MYGAAGAGKSAIAQTIAEILDSRQFFLASFFFSRNDPRRRTARFLIPTLAYQLAAKLPPKFRESIVQAFESDPLIVNRSLESQFKALILDPLLQLFQSGFSIKNHVVVTIDGLDECDDRKIQVRIVELSFSVFRSRDLPLKILITSRPELEITSSFYSQPPNVLARVALDEDYRSNEDVRCFLTDKFYDIKTQHPLRSHIPEGWPPTDSLSTVVRRSSGQFIYAATVVKYVESPRHRPVHRLEIVLGIRPPTASEIPLQSSMHCTVIF